MLDGGLSIGPPKEISSLLASAIALVSTTALLMAVPLILNSITRFVYLYCILTGSYIFLVGSMTKAGSIADRISSKHSLLLSGAISLLVRAPYLLLSIPLSTDVFSYFRFSLLMSVGKIPYVDFYFPYGPLAAALLLPLSSLGSSMAFSYCVRLIMVSFDLIGMFALFAFASRAYGKREASVLSLLYVTFPVLVIESALNGHIDTILSASVILAALFSQYRHPKAYVAVLVSSVLVRFHMLFACVVCLLGRSDSGRRVSRIIALVLALILTTIGLSYYSGLWIPIWHFMNSLAHTYGFIVATNSESWVVSFIAFLLSLISFGGALFSSNRHVPSLLRKCFFALGFTVIVVGLSRLVHAEDILINRYWWRPPDAEYLLAFFIVTAGVLLVAISTRWPLCLQNSLRSKSLFVLLGTFFLILSLRTLHGWYTIWLLPFIFIERPDRHSMALMLVALVLACSYYEPDLPLSSDFGYVLHDVNLSPEPWSLNWSAGSPLVTYRAVADSLVLSAKRTAEGAYGAGFTSSLGLSVDTSLTMAVAVARSNSEPYLGEGFDMGIALECMTGQGETEHVLLGVLPNQDLTNESTRTFRYDFRAGFSGEILVRSVTLFVNVTNPNVDLAQYSVSRIAFVQRPVGLSCPIESAFISVVSVVLVIAANYQIVLRRSPR